MDIDRLEAAAFNAWPSIYSVLLDGWLLRVSDGYTRRANSANFVYVAQHDLESLLAESAAIFDRCALPPTYRIVERPETAAVDQLLEQRGFVAIDRSIVMTCDLTRLADRSAMGRVAPITTDAWLPVFGALSGAIPSNQRRHRAIVRRILAQTIPAAVFEDSAPIACGLGVVERDLLGLFDLVTRPDRRGLGYGTTLIRGLAGHAIDLGARMAYLQVMERNEGAYRLYRRLGFEDAYRYGYRVRLADPPR